MSFYHFSTFSWTEILRKPALKIIETQSEYNTIITSLFRPSEAPALFNPLKQVMSKAKEIPYDFLNKAHTD